MGGNKRVHGRPKFALLGGDADALQVMTAPLLLAGGDCRAAGPDGADAEAFGILLWTIWPVTPASKATATATAAAVYTYFTGSAWAGKCIAAESRR